MNKIYLLIARFVFVVLLSGCEIDRIVTASDLDWWTPEITSNDCPNLSGNYIYSVTQYSNGGHADDLILFYAGSSHLLRRTARTNSATGKSQIPVNYLEDIPKYQSYYFYNSMPLEKITAKAALPKDGLKEILSLEQTSKLLVRGKPGEVQLVTRLGTTMSGCSNGALIMRHLENNGGNDFVPRTVVYGEFEMRKTRDGSLTITERRRQRPVSFSSGMLGDQKEFPAVTRTYQPVGR